MKLETFEEMGLCSFYEYPSTSPADRTSRHPSSLVCHRIYLSAIRN